VGNDALHIALGCDHRGLTVKQAILEVLPRMQHSWRDFGCYDGDSVDYPDIARDVAKAVTGGKFEQGILICGTGIGMSIAANKIKGIRAALCYDVFAARRSRQHNNANILCLKGEDVEVEVALEIVEAYLSGVFEGGRHLARLKKIEAMEGE
jgi:ribose 5-phosphate isomerase B